jgi:hypothetical protein
MRQFDVEEALGGYIEAIDRLRPDPDRLQAAVAASPNKATTRISPATHRRWTPLAIGLTCLLLSAAVAAAASGWLGSALDPFFDGGTAPGRELSGNDLPAWLRPSPGFNAPSEVSEVAAAGDEHLYAYRQGKNICFDYGHHVGECRSPEEWARELETEPWIVRPGNRSVWFGLVDANVNSVEIEYRRGAPTDVPVSNGGFVALIDRTREPRRLIGLNANGTEVASQSLGPEAPY